jgi:flagellar biosynthesis/type III secretory pathway chaperone
MRFVIIVLIIYMAKSYKEILDEMDKLQRLESSLYRQKNNLAHQGSSDDMSRIVRDIQEITARRLTLYNTLDQASKLIADTMNSTHTSLHRQSMAGDIIEEDVPTSLSKMGTNIIHEKNINLKRQIELMEDNKNRNRAYSDITWGIVNMLTVIICIIAISKQSYFPISPIITNALIMATLVLGLLRLTIAFIIIWYRNNMNFEKFDWPWWLPKGKGNSSGNMGIHVADINVPDISLGCIGESCCGLGTKWDSITLMCAKVT